ncbi:MAG: hypothetical protein DWQ05_18660 [Calditrichaeota bacterium]|nr:MAG: hypothetical protein DWQ05_18660 [Calditrichota bacterium]
MRIIKNLSIILSIGLLILHTSCSSNPASPDPTDGSIKISVRGVADGSSTSLKKMATAIMITSARVVIEEIEFESSTEDRLDFELEEPFVQDLVAGSNLHEVTTVQVPFGTYRELEIKIDELDEEKSIAYAQNPELQNLSIRVEGFLNDDTNNTFVFTSDLSEEQEKEFYPPLVIDETNPSVNVVLAIDMGMWFVDSNNGLLDPTLEENKSRIESNIKASINVFEDEDDDGERDDDDS